MDRPISGMEGFAKWPYSLKPDGTIIIRACAKLNVGEQKPK